MTEALAQAFASGRLVRPSADQPNFVDLVLAMAKFGGVADLPGGAEAAKIAKLIGAPQHLVFVLVDGLGMNLLEQLPADSFLRQHLTGELQAVFPSTTASALTTLATGAWPCEHGMPGWWVYVDEEDVSVTSLPFEERFTRRPASDLGVTMQMLWPLPALMAMLSRQAAAVLPAEICDSPFSRYACGDRPGLAYATIAAATDAAMGWLGDVRPPSYLYVYLPHLDAACHREGIGGPAVEQVLHDVDEQLARLAEATSGRARIIVSADHGMIDVREQDRLALFDGDPLLDLLLAPPTGEPRVPMFHVKPGMQERFVAAFNERFGRRMALLSVDEVQRLKLLGPGPLSVLARRRFGDYLGVALDPVTLKYYSPGSVPANDHVGFHAGLTPQEMRTPLIVA